MEKLAQLGFILALRGRVGLAWTPDGAGEELVRVCAGGVTAAGGRAELFPNLNSPVEGSWAARRWGLPAFLFFDTEGPPRLHLFDRLGLPFAPDALSRLKEALSQPATGGAEGGAWTVRCVPPGLWAGETARQLALRGSGPPWRRRAVGVRCSPWSGTGSGPADCTPPAPGCGPPPPPQAASAPEWPPRGRG